MSVPAEENTFVTDANETSIEARKGRWTAGIALVAIGLLALIAEFGDGLGLGRYFLVLLGGIFLLWGIWVRSPGLLIPGGILSGIGLGVYLLSGVLPGLDGRAEGGVFMLAFAAGWLLILPLSLWIRREVQWWVLIPSGIMAVIGGALLAGGLALDLLGMVGRAWPLGLIAFGLYLIVRRGQSPN